ncbi:hypothetical protein ACFYY8_06275 [Streptosporangium sp. NPDC001559]|uniref:hypothetical protein n=1 Tax=Streptosporangium sp. NPDC001559 TaxID=3366187 RepID=UPI0036E374EC
MTTITNTVKDASGAPVSGVQVTAHLVAASGFLAGGGEIVKEVATASAADGTWSLTLTPTESLAYPDGAHYVVSEGERRHTITVPATGEHNVADVLISTPGVRADVGLTVTSGDARYERTSQRGQPNGYPSLGADGLVPTSQLPAGQGGDAVSSVNGRTGVVTLTAADVGAATAGHTHTGVYDPAGTASSLMTSHTGAADPHPQYVTASEGAASYAPTAHSHAGGDITSGILAVARLPVGTASETVAAGDDARIVGAVPKSTVTAKGDLLYGAGAATVGRLPVGTDGQLLSAASGQASGLQWVDPPSGGGGSGGGPVYPLSAYGLLAASGDPETFMLGSGASANTILGSRMEIPAGVTITRLWAAVRAGGTYAASAVPNRLGLYTDEGVLVDATADDSTLWTAAGWRGGALVGGPIAAQSTPRMAYVLLIFGGMTNVVMPYPASANDAQSSWFCRGPSASGPRRAFYTGAGGGDLPSSFNPASYGTETTYLSLVGVT